MAELHHTSCPLCGSDRLQLYCTTGDHSRPGPSLQYRLDRCRECGLVYLNPRPGEREIDAFYRRSDYLPFASLTETRSSVGALYKFLRRYNLRWKRRLVLRIQRRLSVNPLTPTKLLDVGCGTGEFLVEMKRAGWDVEGLEQDERASAWARDRGHVSVQTGRVEQLSSAEKRYDVITLWHVLEHFHDPGRALEILRNRLNDNGLLLVAVPNLRGIDSRFYSENWVALDAPRHLSHFSLKTLTEIGSRKNFELRYCEQLPLDAFFNSIMSERLLHRSKGGGLILAGLRYYRGLCVAVASLIGGSRTPLTQAKYGATLVCCFKKVRSLS